MGLLTRGDHVLIRRGRTSVKLNFAEIELRGMETTLRQIETRLVDAINTTMTGKSFVAIRIHSLVPLKYDVLNGPPGSTPSRQWWDRFRGL